MCVLGVRSRVKAQGVSEVETAKEKAFSAIAEAQPESVRYASIKAGDGATFVSLELEKQRACLQGRRHSGQPSCDASGSVAGP